MIKQEHVEKAEARLEPCPFCGQSVEIGICDDEGNPHDREYLDDPWSGLSFGITHMKDEECLLNCRGDDDEFVGSRLFKSLDDLVRAWNHRHRDMCAPVVKCLHGGGTRIACDGTRLKHCSAFDGFVEGWWCNEHCTEYRTNPAENEEDD